MTLNEKKLTEMVEAVMKLNQSAHRNRLLIEQNSIEQVKTDIATALTKFALEMTDEEIMNEAEKIKIGTSVAGMYEITDVNSTEIARGYYAKGAKQVRDGK